MNPTITNDEIGVLRLAEGYGNGLDLAGPRIGARVKVAARECVRKGWLVGKMSGLAMTDSGTAMLAQEREQIHPVA